MKNRRLPIDFQDGIYNSRIGKFTQPDTIIPGAGNPQAFNRYAYVLNNPVNFVDPSGHAPCISEIRGKCPKPSRNRSSTLNSEDIARVSVQLCRSYEGKMIPVRRIENCNNGGVLVPDGLLTHGHFDNSQFTDENGDLVRTVRPNLGNGPNEKMRLTLGDGKFTTTDRDSSDFTFHDQGCGQRCGRDQQFVEGFFFSRVARIAQADVISDLSVGSKVQVAFNSSNDSFQLSVAIMEIYSLEGNPGYQDSILVVDENRLIGYGDSGFGVFYNGFLIGTVSGIIYSPNGQQLVIVTLVKIDD